MQYLNRECPSRCGSEHMPHQARTLTQLMCILTALVRPRLVLVQCLLIVFGPEGSSLQSVSSVAEERWNTWRCIDSIGPLAGHRQQSIQTYSKSSLE